MDPLHWNGRLIPPEAESKSNLRSTFEDMTDRISSQEYYLLLKRNVQNSLIFLFLLFFSIIVWLSSMKFCTDLPEWKYCLCWDIIWVELSQISERAVSRERREWFTAFTSWLGDLYQEIRPDLHQRTLPGSLYFPAPRSLTVTKLTRLAVPFFPHF